jgi:hypothetical protein
MIPYRFDRKLKKQWKSNRQNKENLKVINSKDKILTKSGTLTKRNNVDNFKLKNNNNNLPTFSSKAQRAKSSEKENSSIIKENLTSNTSNNNNNNLNLSKKRRDTIN